MTRSFVHHALAVVVLAGTATAAQAQAALTLACPTPAAGPATTLVVATGPGWTFKEMNATAWENANSAYQHAAWYNPAAAGNPGTWLTPDDPTTLPMYPTPTGSRFDFRSPAITVDPRIDLSTITASFERTADNYYHDVGLVNAGTPPAGTFGGASYIGGGNHGVLSTPTNVTLPWTTGANQLLLRISNAEHFATVLPDTNGVGNPPEHGPMGVYTKVTLNATCLPQAAPSTVQAVPADNPWALLLAGAALAGLGARRLRRRKP
ncbi:MAG: IPTL-CTERM sorting domain-containing protein [Pseudomonadota bacterium]|nr:IPTL-CTERM sorting domain-containing protein [Pseudomonadota bacterium]